MKKKIDMFAVLLSASVLAHVPANTAYAGDADIDYSAFTQINEQYTVEDGDCLRELITPLSVKKTVTRDCYLVNPAEPLTLSTTFQDYPSLVDNPRTVQYWVGGYAKDISVERVFLRQLVNSCHPQIIDSRDITITTPRTKTFDVINPNLDPSITEDHMLLRMTRDQAETQLQASLQSCKEDSALTDMP